MTVWSSRKRGSVLLITLRGDAAAAFDAVAVRRTASDFVLSYASDWSLAKSTAPRSTERSLKASVASASRNGSQMK